MNMTPIAIVAIICWALVSLTNTVFGRRKSSSQSKRVDEETAKTIADLQDRVATLEKIVTDEKYNLNKEFENLKNS